jgi:hypothetical protein
MNYTEIISSSLNTLWKKKNLWWIGVIISLASNIGNFPTIFIYNSLLLFGMVQMLGNSRYAEPGNHDLPFLSNLDGEMIWGIGTLLFLVLIITFVYISSVSKVVIIKAAHAFSSHSKEINYSEFWQDGRKNWLKVFKVGIAFFFVMLALVSPMLIGVGLMIVFEDSEVASTIVSLLVCVMYIPIFIGAILGMVTMEFAMRYAVLKNQNTLDSIKHALKLIKSNAGKVALSYLIFYGISMLSSLIFIFVFIFAAIIDFFFAVAFSSLLMADGGISFIIALVAGFFVWIVMIIVSGPIWAFYEIYWSNVYEALTKSTHKSV